MSICLAHSRNCFPLRMGEMSRMFREGREQVDFLVRFIKKYIPGFENCYMSATAAMMGVRESRRVMGEYVLTAEDIAHLRKFDDVICISTHGYDVHNYDGPGNIKWAEMEIDGRTQYVICNAGGFGATTPPPNGMPVVNVRGESMENAVFETNGYYDIPYRCLVPEKLDNLLVAGRNLSSDVNAQSGSRLILACLNMGEAAGTAMAISLAENIPPARRRRKGVTGRADCLGLQHRPEYARDSRRRSQRVVRGSLCQSRAGRLQPPARRLRALA